MKIICIFTSYWGVSYITLGVEGAKSFFAVSMETPVYGHLWHYGVQDLAKSLKFHAPLKHSVSRPLSQSPGCAVDEHPSYPSGEQPCSHTTPKWAYHRLVMKVLRGFLEKILPWAFSGVVGQMCKSTPQTPQAMVPRSPH